jgi:exodeoxyribonuclease VIII
MQKQAIEDMKSVLDADPFIREHLYDKTGVAEQSYYIEYLIPGTDLKTKIKCKPDWETDYAIFDYKSAKDASYYGFMKAVSSLLYGMSAAMYREIVSIETGLLKPFVWIAQEKEPPYAAAIYVASAEDLRKGMTKFLQLLTNHAMCLEANYWPGYTAFGTQRADFRFNGAQISNTKWDNEALALASGAITDEIIQVRKI